MENNEKLRMESFFYQGVSFAYLYASGKRGAEEAQYAINHLETVKKIHSEMSSLGMVDEGGVRAMVLNKLEVEVANNDSK